MKQVHYEVRVNIPVQLSVVLNWDGDSLDDTTWRNEFRAAQTAAIMLAISHMPPEALTEALETLQCDGLGYPDDFAEVIESNSEDIPHNEYPPYRANICPNCGSSRIGNKCRRCGYDKR